MARRTLKGKKFTWHHVSEFSDHDLESLQKDFKFHPLDFDDVREMAELPKLDIYKNYLFGIFSIPYFDVEADRIKKADVAIFWSSKEVVMVTKEKIDVINRYFARASKSTGLRNDALGKNTGYFIYKLLDYVFRDAKTVLKILSRETQALEESLSSKHAKQTTRRLGLLRRNLLFLRHIIDPQRIMISQISNTKKGFIPSELDVYFDDLKDTLDGMWVIADNLKNIVDGLFDVNEALLSHRTNEIIRVLTVISVVLMPPTLIASYYGMNVQGLPFSNDIKTVSLIIIASLISFWMFVWFIDKRK
ncbi:magnesium transporter CorA family protein [Candidatus Uhrbacteria bacterium]|jgi:magnesium transporter|nr:magnesium transporter CorA family protein [Candidatus Uhrbacteria bacterium]MBT7717394.1 magnesium transporter CorA family protein [Candidatus Uhrbacteria bacterium]